MSPYNNQFRIELPEGWEDQTVHYFMGPLDSGVQHSLTLFIDRRPSTSDVQEYARERIAQTLEIMPGMEVIKEEGKTLHGDMEAYEAVCKWIPPGGSPTYRKLVYIIKDKTAYTFTGDFSKRTLKTRGVQMDSMIEGFTPGTNE